MSKREESPFKLFTMFVRGYKGISPMRTDEQKKRGAPAGPMDWPLLRYAISLESRVPIAAYIIDQIEIWNEKSVEEAINVREQGVGSNQAGMVLVYYFESLADQIYKTMETIAKINLFMFSIEGNPPHGFHDQNKNILGWQIVPLSPRLRRTLPS